MLTFIDFFAGIGGFRRGMELAGHKCIGFCEFDKFAAAGYTAMHLMTDEDRERIAALVNSDSQLCRQAGNGVTVPVIRAIAEGMEI